MYVSVEQPPPFTIVDTPGKGRGIVASRDISRGDLVLAEVPAFSLSTQDEPNLTDNTVAAALRSLSKADQLAFLSLHNKYPKVPGNPVLMNIVRTNGFQLGETAEGGIFLTASFFNHSCTPNVHRSWHSTSRRLRFYATLDIKAGDELCIAYFPGGIEDVRTRRQKHFEPFGPECKCSTCTLPATELAKSDERRAAKAGLDNVIRWNYYAPQENMRAVLRVLAFLKTERLEERIGDACWCAVQVCAASQDAASAKIWMQRYIDVLTLLCGSGYDGSLGHLRFIDDPRKHEVWGLGRRANLMELTQSWKA